VDCDQVKGSLEAFNAGELPRDEAARVAGHLAACPQCEIECEELRELAADLRHAGDALRPLQPFEIPAESCVPPRRRRRSLVVIGAVAAVWMILLTTAMLWPSLAARLTFLPVGRRLSAVSSPSPSASPGSAGGRYSLTDAPGEALSAVAALFGASPHMRMPARAAVAPELSRLLAGALDLERTAVRLVALGPVVSVQKGQIQLVATVDITPDAKAATPQPRRYDFLVTLTYSARGRWEVSKVTVLARPR